MADLAVGLIKSVVERTLSKAHAAVQEEARRDLVFITDEFEMMRSFLNVANAKRVENPVVRTWVRQIRDLAYDVEDCIDLVLYLEKEETRFWFRLRRLCVPWARPQAVDEIKQLKARVADVSARNARYSLISDTSSKPVGEQQLTAAAAVRDTVAASNMLAEARDVARREQDVLGGDLTQLITREAGGDHDLQVISVWGSAGEHGTTSIIMKTYSDPEIYRNFTHRAWVKLIRPFSPHDLIQSLMLQFCAAMGMDVLTILQGSQEVLFRDFHELFTQARYLVVVEDLSNMADWHVLRAFLPDKRKGSCIIVSTQQPEVASLCIGHPYQILQLKQFSAEHSVCALFRKGSHGHGDTGKKTVEGSPDVGCVLKTDTGSKPRHMSLQHLKDITKNFSEDRILGSGGFGVVYKGSLRHGEVVAVKKLMQSTLKTQKQFENEVDLLMTLKHRNVVRLLGYCYETQFLHMPYEGKLVSAEHTEHLLCLECMPGSLDKYIKDVSSGHDWHTRYRIIEGISFGLQYLHEESNGPIIHLDLKPANILLDENLVPKITDFGLSRLFDNNQTIRTATSSGTLGYMALEYQLRGVITPMADIFSLGVIIMEVITGHREYPYDIRTSSKDFIKHELEEWRNKLQKEPGYASLESDCQQIERCIQIGLLCVNPERTKRPTMKKIIDMLQGLESMDLYITKELSSHDIMEEP